MLSFIRSVFCRMNCVRPLNIFRPSSRLPTVTSYSVQETSGEERLKQHLSIRTRKATNSELGNVYSKPSGLPWALGLKSAPFSNITSMGSPNYLGLIVTRCMSTVRRLNVVETVALRQSLMLPSVFKSLELGEIVKRGSERASRILENLFTGEFSSTNPGDFVKSLRKLQNDVNRKIENIVELAKDMQDSSVETSFIYVNGRVAITGDKLSLDTSDIVKELEKYNNPDAFRLFAKSECEELASGFKDELLPERCNNESVITGLEEQFSYLSSEELEAFTAWTDLGLCLGLAGPAGVPLSMSEAFSKWNKKIYYWHIFIALVALKYIVLCILELRQYLYIRSPTIPADLVGLITLPDYLQLRKLELVSFKFGFYESFAHCTTYLLAFAFGLLPKAWNRFFARTSKFKVFASWPESRKVFLISVIFYVVFSIIQLIVFVPFIFLPRFVGLLPNIEEYQHDLTKMPMLSFWELKLTNHTKIVEGAFVQGAVLLLIYLTSEKSFVWTYFLSLTAIICVTLKGLLGQAIWYGLLIVPATESQLKPFKSILEKLSFPFKRVFFDEKLMNAYTTGIGKLGIIVIGEMLSKLGVTQEHLVAIVGHELGHWFHNHMIWIGLFYFVLLSLVAIPVLYLIRRPALYRSFGFIVEKDSPIPYGVGLILVLGILDLVEFFFLPLSNYFSWVLEYQADRFSVKLGLGEALLSSMPHLHPCGSRLADWVYGIFQYDHPVYSCRAKAIMDAFKSYNS